MVVSARQEQGFIPSLLDRLIDEDPRSSREVPLSPNQALRQLKLAVRRDLENLLNTRVRNLTWPAHLEELERSLVNYGLADFSRTTLVSTQDRQAFCRLLEKVIRQHEPRLLSVTLEPLTNAEPLDRTFRFRIDGLLRTEPAPEPVVFDSMVKASTGDFEVKGST